MRRSITSKTLKLVSLVCAALIYAATGLHAQSGVTAVLPNGREIHPAGNWIPLAPYPFALAVRPDGNQIAVPSIGFPFALNVVDDPSGASPAVLRMPPGTHNDPAVEVHAGLAYSPDGALLYVATGDSGKIRAYRTGDWKPVNEISLDGPIAGKQSSGSFAATLILSPDGQTIYALDQGNWRIVILDAATLTRIAEIPTGSYPFGLALSPDGARLYVTNTGLFEYTTVPGVSENNKLGTGLHWAPFGYPSRAARSGTVAEGKRIPGLGDENSVRGSSLWTYEVRDRQHPAVTAKLRLGARIGEAPGQSIGGAAPSGVAAAADAVYVALAHDDSVAKVSADGTRLLAQTELSPFTGPRFPGFSRPALARRDAERPGGARRAGLRGRGGHRRGRRARCRHHADHRAHPRRLEPLGRRPLAGRQDALCCEYKGQGRGAKWRQPARSQPCPRISVHSNWAA